MMRTFTAFAPERGKGASIAFGRGNDVAEVLDHPQVAARDRLLPTATVNGPVDLLHPPFNIEGVDAPPGAVPGLGEHTDAILHELGYTATEITALHRDGAV